MVERGDATYQVKMHQMRGFKTQNFPFFRFGKQYFVLFRNRFQTLVNMLSVLDACISIIRASGRGLGPRILEFFWPCEMASSR
jgi:hypothetical protein